MRSKSFSSRLFSRGMQISESSVKMLLHHSTSIFTFGVKQNHKTVDWLRLNETSGHPPSCSSRATCLPRTMPRQFLSISSDGDSTTFLGNLSTAQISSQISNVQRKLPVFQSFAFFSCPWVPLWAWVHFLCTLPSGSLARSSLSIHSDLPAYLADFVQSEPELGRGDRWILTNFLSPLFSPRTFLLYFPKSPYSPLHCNTPDTEAIPPHLQKDHSPQLHTGLSLIVLIPHAACMRIQALQRHELMHI